jgi:hypothetical protein
MYTQKIDSRDWGLMRLLHRRFGNEKMNIASAAIAFGKFHFPMLEPFQPLFL